MAAPELLEADPGEALPALAVVAVPALFVLAALDDGAEPVGVPVDVAPGPGTAVGLPAPAVGAAVAEIGLPMLDPPDQGQK